MKYIGIDFGEKHIGVAVSNEEGTMAFPHASIANSAMLVSDIQKILLDKKAEGIVMGESKDYQGAENKVMVKARQFAEELETATGLTVIFEPEFLTSKEARHIQGGGEKTHASAAALILKSFLDRKSN